MDKKYVHSGCEIVYIPKDPMTGSKGVPVYTAVMEEPWQCSENIWKCNLAGVKGSVPISQIEKWIR